MSKFRIAVLVLVVATVIYGVALALSVQAYENWKNEYWGDCPDDLRHVLEKYIDLPPFWMTEGGGWFIVSGFLLASAWVGIVATRKGEIRMKTSEWEAMAYVLLVVSLISAALVVGFLVGGIIVPLWMKMLLKVSPIAYGTVILGGLFLTVLSIMAIIFRALGGERK